MTTEQLSQNHCSLIGRFLNMMKNKQTNDYLEKEIHKSTFFFVSVILLKGMKSSLQKYKTSKKLESLPKKELVVCRKQWLLQLLNYLYLNCLYMKEFHDIKMIRYSYIGLKILRGQFHLKLLKLLVIKKVISNLFPSFYLIYCKIFALINKSFLGEKARFTEDSDI